MSKKVNEQTTATTTTTTSLKEYMEKYSNVSLRKLATATVELSKATPENFGAINYGVFLAKSKMPVPGEMYDPASINWDALEQKLAEKGFTAADFDWAAMNDAGSSAVSKNVEDFPVGTQVYLRRNNDTPYTVMYKTNTHIVIQLDGTSEPLAWANNTFLLNGPQLQPRATKETTEAGV